MREYQKKKLKKPCLCVLFEVFSFGADITNSFDNNIQEKEIKNVKP